MSMPSSAHCVGMRSVDCSCMCECASARAYALTCLHSLTPAHEPVGASFDTNDRQPCFALYGRGIHKNKRCSSRNAQNSAGARCNVWSASLGANPTHILLRTTVHSTPCILQLWQALQRPWLMPCSFDPEGPHQTYWMHCGKCPAPSHSKGPATSTC